MLLLRARGRQDQQHRHELCNVKAAPCEVQDTAPQAQAFLRGRDKRGGGDQHNGSDDVHTLDQETTGFFTTVGHGQGMQEGIFKKSNCILTVYQVKTAETHTQTQPGTPGFMETLTDQTKAESHTPREIQPLVVGREPRSSLCVPSCALLLSHDSPGVWSIWSLSLFFNCSPALIKSFPLLAHRNDNRASFLPILAK